MSSITISTFQNLERNSFENFNEFIALRLEDGIFRALAEKQRLDLQANKSAVVELPWGTYSAEVKGAADSGNITPTWEPSKAFIGMLHGDENAKDQRQETFDEQFAELFKNYVAYGHLYPDRIGKDAPAKEKGIKMTPDEIEFFLNDYCTVLSNIARDKQRAGKSYRLEINEGFPHGTFDFEYPDDETIKVTFIPHKVYKQYLKDDEMAAKAVGADFRPVHDGETRITRMPNAEEMSEAAFTKILVNKHGSKAAVRQMPMEDNGEFYALRPTKHKKHK